MNFSSDPLSGVREMQELDGIAESHGFLNARHIEMPANNLMVVWER